MSLILGCDSGIFTGLELFEQNSFLWILSELGNTFQC